VLKKRKYLVVTIKDWNIEEYKQYSKEIEGEWHLITSKQELNARAVRQIGPEYIFFLHWSWVVPKEITDNYQCVCFHMTDLPYGRGGSPLQNLIVRGYKKTKITAFRMTQELDAGDIYKKIELDLSGSAQEIFVRASKKTVQLINLIVSERPTPRPQEGQVSLFDRRTSKQSEIPKDANISDIYDHIRMLDADTYPRAYINYGDYRLTFSNAKIEGDKLNANIEMRRVDE